MKTLTLFFVFLFLSSATLWAQSDQSLLAEVSLAIDKNVNDRAEKLFGQMIREDVEKAEIFYWINLDKHHTITPKLAYGLAVYHEHNFDYEKAHVYYKEWIKFFPGKTDGLLTLARVEMLCGKEVDALHTYERILELEPDNLDAHIYAANFYYLQGKLEKEQIENDYKHLKSPTRMQYARYRNSLDQVFSDKYTKARGHFEKILTLFSSTGARKALAEIRKVEKEISGK